MKSLTTGLLLLIIGLPVAVQAAMPDQNGRVTSADGNASIVIDAPHTYASAFLDSDTYTSRYTLQVHAQHRGQSANLFLGGTLDGFWFLRTPQGWIPWDNGNEYPTPFARVLLQDSVTIDVFENNYLPAGEIQIYAAYQLDGEEPVIGPQPLEFSIQSGSQDALHPFRSGPAMEEFLKQGLQSSASNRFYATVDFEQASTADSNGVYQSDQVSATNLQEQGVDEADVVKSDGRHLFALRNCAPVSCVVTFELDNEAATATELNSTALAGQLTPSGMYLVQGRTGGDRLVTIGSEPSFHLWLDVWGWSGNTTELEFFNADDPAALESLESLTLDGNLIASRRIEDTLYVVTRYTPYLNGYVSYAYEEQPRADNAALLTTSSLTELLPKITNAGQQTRNLIDPERCYLTTRDLELAANPSIVTVTAIPLEAPGEFTSTCFVGDSETLYMTPQSLYLATTQYEYANDGFDRLFYQPEHSTAIHKFALEEDGIAYRGSGQVQGHLGWSEDKKSFRMGENGDYLNLVTSVGVTWDASSSTMLTVLQDSGEGLHLRTVDTIKGIGKPGEQLYAARFLGERAYLVTFLLTDPLYVIDLSDQENPAIVGELEIEGYSDYLQPVGENLVLGIGKDAIADESSLDFNGTRGAWYQGVKLSLFNVADPTSPFEVDSLVLGKRGSQSEALYDHHALAFLPATESELARIALPVDLHDTVPPYAWFDPDSANAYYDYTHTGLYSFEIGDDGISQLDLIYGTEPGSTGLFGDRAVLADDAIHYIHHGGVISSLWGETP